MIDLDEKDIEALASSRASRPLRKWFLGGGLVVLVLLAFSTVTTGGVAQMLAGLALAVFLLGFPAFVIKYTIKKRRIKTQLLAHWMEERDDSR